MTTNERPAAYIGGEWVHADGEQVDVIDSTTERPLGAVTLSTAKQADVAVDAAASAQAAWGATPGEERARLVEEIGRRLAPRADELCELIEDLH